MILLQQHATHEMGIVSLLIGSSSASVFVFVIKCWSKRHGMVSIDSKGHSGDELCLGQIFKIQ